MVEFFQSLRGTIWQERLLFLQQNAETYRWVCVGIFVVTYLLTSLMILRICKNRLSMDVGSVCFVPIVGILVLVWGIFSHIISKAVEKISSIFGKKDLVKASKPTNDGDDSFDLF